MNSSGVFAALWINQTTGLSYANAFNPNGGTSIKLMDSKSNKFVNFPDKQLFTNNTQYCCGYADDISIDQNNNVRIVGRYYPKNGTGTGTIMLSLYNYSWSNRCIPGLSPSNQCSTIGTSVSDPYYPFGASSQPKIATAADGTSVIMWSKSATGSNSLFKMKINSLGQRISWETLVTNQVSLDGVGSNIAIRDDGTHVVTWYNPIKKQLFAKTFHTSEVLDVGAFALSSWPLSGISMDPDPSYDNFTIFTVQQTPGTRDIVGQKFNTM